MAMITFVTLRVYSKGKAVTESIFRKVKEGTKKNMYPETICMGNRNLNSIGIVVRANKAAWKLIRCLEDVPPTLLYFLHLLVHDLTHKLRSLRGYGMSRKRLRICSTVPLNIA